MDIQKKILIDASHLEETRVAILKNNELDEYEFEVESKKELKGNIYLAKITKVESSLQAAFVEYGKNKQGFLPFNEISINYFDIADADKNAILEKQINYKEKLRQRAQENKLKKEEEKLEKESQDLLSSIDDNSSENISSDILKENKNLETDFIEEDELDLEDLKKQADEENQAYGSRFGYKIQDVIKPNQYIIVQVVKEERGNKGASLTAYLSLPGRYCVLMPYTPFEGGISKRINNPSDRERLKNIIEELKIPMDINIIIRTASLEKTDQEIIQDYKYVYSLWQSIHKQASTMKNPGIIFEEGMLIKRVIRDLYSGDVEEIIIEGKDAYHTVKNFTKIIAPEITDRITLFKHPKLSIFKAFNVDEEIRSIYSSIVFLPSGGYLVVNNTEALIAIDVNSGKSKGKTNVEETALRTNLEAAAKIAKHIKLCDIGGLIVIDFIDMENPKNRTLVERKLKEACKEDKAKIQIGQISSFGLLEISRQRIKSSLLERNFNVCPKCHGSGYIRSLPLNALNILRNIFNDVENHNVRFSSRQLILSLPKEEAFYILNNKRYHLITLENILKSSIRVECDNNLSSPFYKFREEEKKVENPEITLFLHQEIEDHNNRKKQTKPEKQPVEHKPQKVAQNKQSNTPKKSGWIRKIIGF